MRSVGVEEELLLVHPETGEPQAVSGAILAAAGREGEFEAELHREQLEFATEPHRVMTDLAGEVRRWRKLADERAAEVGARVAALATSPLEADPTIGTGERYRWLSKEFGLTTQEQLTCGCHIHVEVASDDEGVGVIDRIRPWLPPLLALSANSPFWQGVDSGYSSYRSRVWSRWPSAGPMEVFGSAERYHQRVGAMLATGTLLDKGMIYFDARLSHRYPTVEVRVADVCLEADDTVLVAALVRGLVETAARDLRDGRPAPEVGVGELRLAAWRAARSGITGDLVHPLTWRPAAAETVLAALLDHTSDALADSDDLSFVRKRLDEVLSRGNGSQRQRNTFARTGDPRAVVADAVERTAA
ncbi:glutamate--cysteine ligase [Streptomyces pactum]|uniref:Putative glutamate--cysteine ligase 2 n=1 Tax=Streptomyces pactum TaxID=68249 RepID=A0ABS0NS92_9ACTN|nr:glutamate--cysteine ligase [Streptomyces pactum]MBH5338061.1 glutamate--cysteine ligase [Streptomyces pactum]